MALVVCFSNVCSWKVVEGAKDFAGVLMTRVISEDALFLPIIGFLCRNLHRRISDILTRLAESAKDFLTLTHE